VARNRDTYDRSVVSEPFRWFAGPQFVDEAIRRNRLPGRGQQQGEECSLASSAERQPRSVGQGLDRAEDAEVGWAVSRLRHLSGRFGHRNHDAAPASRRRTASRRGVRDRCYLMSGGGREPERRFDDDPRFYCRSRSA
jgi:hypothetical protein